MQEDAHMTEQVELINHGSPLERLQKLVDHQQTCIELLYDRLNSVEQELHDLKQALDEEDEEPWHRWEEEHP